MAKETAEQIAKYNKNTEKLIELLLNYNSEKFIVYSKDDTTTDKFCITFVDAECCELSIFFKITGFVIFATGAGF